MAELSVVLPVENNRQNSRMGGTHSPPPDQNVFNSYILSDYGSSVRICWLGGIVYTAFYTRIENFYDSCHRKLRRWSTDCVVRWLLSVMICLNPQLSVAERSSLSLIISRAIDQLVWERSSVDVRVLRGIVALACPNQETALLLCYLMEIITDLITFSHDQKADDENAGSNALDLESPRSCQSNPLSEAKKIVEILTRVYNVEPMLVAVMPDTVKKSIFQALNGGLDVTTYSIGSCITENKLQKSPICCITLEPLLNPDGTVTEDVVAVIQRSSTIEKNHAFLYRGCALHRDHEADCGDRDGKRLQINENAKSLWGGKGLFTFPDGTDGRKKTVIDFGRLSENDAIEIRV